MHTEAHLRGSAEQICAVPDLSAATSLCRVTTALGFFSMAYTFSSRPVRRAALRAALTSGPLPAPTTCNRRALSGSLCRTCEGPKKLAARP